MDDPQIENVSCAAKAQAVSLLEHDKDYCSISKFLADYSIRCKPQPISIKAKLLFQVVDPDGN